MGFTMLPHVSFVFPRISIVRLSSGWAGLGCIGLGWAGLGWVTLDCAGLDWAGLNLAGLGWLHACLATWAGPGCAELCCAELCWAGWQARLLVVQLAVWDEEADFRPEPFHQIFGKLQLHFFVEFPGTRIVLASHTIV